MQLGLNLVANTERTNDIEEEVWNVNSNGNWNNWNYYDYLNYRNHVLPFFRSFYFLSLLCSRIKKF